MADYEKLIDLTSKNLACLCFRNTDRLSIAKITDIFSEYGTVVGVNCAGDEDGFRFVRYRTKEEALEAAMHLEGNSSIQLQPVKHRHKDYQFPKNEQANRDEWRNYRATRYDEETDKPNSTKGGQSLRNGRQNNNQKPNNDNRMKHDHSRFDNPNKYNSESRQDHSNVQDSARQHYNFKATREVTYSNESDDKKKETQSPNTSTNRDRFLQLSKLRGTVANTFQRPDGVARNLSAVSDALASLAVATSPPSSQHSSRGQSVNNDVPPPLIASLSSPQFGPVDVEEEKKIVVAAYDVILANIHPNFGIRYIYQMLRKYSPIYVSDIETVPDINVRFCYVYFDTPANALLVEESLNGVSLGGKNLIMLRSQVLEAKAGAL